MITNKLEIEVKLYKTQFDKFCQTIFGGYQLDRLSLDLDGMSFRIKYMIKHNKDLDKLDDMKLEFSNKALELRNTFGEFMYEFLCQVVGIPEYAHIEDIIDILAKDVKIDTINVSFTMIVLSDNTEYLQYLSERFNCDIFNMFPDEYFRYQTDSYNDAIAKAYPELFENRHQDKVGIGADGDVFCHNFTFQTSERCSLNCTYCYQFNKSEMRMSFETAKTFIDNLLDDKYGYINRYNSPAIIIEFIGGEPLLEIKLTRKIYEYFLDRCYELNHPWFHLHRVSICSNGLSYFDQEVQDFFKDYASNISFNISIDGNKELHDACRIQPNGEGSYDICMAALNHFNKHYTSERNSKMTLAPTNIKYLFDSVIDFINHDMKIINLNCVFEEGWNQETAREEYYQLKKLADHVIDNDLENIYIAIFNERQEGPQLKENDGNFCGGLGSMLSLRPNGDFYPCIRYMPTSIGEGNTDYCIGNVNDGLIGREQDSEVLNMMDNITRRSQSNDICYDCPLSNDCAWCFKAGTLIETINGPIPIEQLHVGNLVLSSDGSYHKVNNNMSRIADTDETIILTVLGSSPIYTTKEHPIWARKFIKYVYKNKSRTRVPEFSEPMWIKAGDLSNHDMVLMIKRQIGDIDVNFYIAYLVGRWLGDGWRSDNKSWNNKVYPEFHICCSYDETSELEEYFRKANIDFSIDKTPRTAQEYLIKSNTKNLNNKYLISILKNCGKYDHGKHLSPDIFKWNSKSLLALISGYISADGSSTQKPNMIGFTTVSKQLAYDISVISRMLWNINMSWSVRYKNTDMIDRRNINTRISYDIRAYDSDRSLSMIDEKNNMWSPVRSVKPASIPYIVYNLSVENDPTFYADGILVHNCSALSATVYGTPNKRPMFICIQMIAEALANVYYWNRLKIKHPEYKIDVRKNVVPDEWAKLVISQEELDELTLLQAYVTSLEIEKE